MCRMMGVVSRDAVPYELFPAFADLASRGMCPVGSPDERGHKDGWGLACFHGGDLQVYMRDVGSAVEAARFFQTASKIAGLRPQTSPAEGLVVLGHVRRASEKSRIGQRWSHPFVVERDGTTWAFQHNGSFAKELPDPDRIDSQILFEWILAGLEGASHEDVSRAAAAARSRTLKEAGGFSSLNFLLTDGMALHVYRDFQTNGEYYTLFRGRVGDMVLAASEPIFGIRGGPLPRGVLHTITPDLEVASTVIA